MEWVPQNNIEQDASDDKSGEKPDKSRRNLEVGRIIGATAEKIVGTTEKKDKVAKESASLLDKLFGTEKAPEQKAVEATASEQPKAETTTEHHAVGALIEGNEVNLREQQRKEIQRVVSRAEQATQEQLEVADGHHIERSAWHKIEVDEHGKAVQDTSFEYGHEYYKERAKETGVKSQGQKQHFDEVAGEVALVAAAMGGDTAPELPTAEPEVPKMPALAPVTKLKPTKDSPQKSLLTTLTSPPTTAVGTVAWSVALVVLLAIFALVVF